MTPRSRLLQLFVALALAAAVVSLGGLSLYRKVQTFQPLGFEAVAAGGFFEVRDGASPLRPGDRILLVDGQRAGSVDELRARIGAAPVHELLVQRGDELITLAVARPALDLDLPYLVLALVGGLYLLIGVYTLLRDGRREALVFYLWTVASAAVYVLTPTPPLDGVGKVAFAVEELARILLPALTLHLFLIFPTALGSSARLRQAIAFAYLPAAVLATLQADLMLAGGRLVLGPPTARTLLLLDRIELYLLVLYALVSVALLVRRLDLHRGWEQHRQVLWVALGMAGGYVPFVLLYVGPLALRLPRSELLTTLGVAPLAFVPLAFAYAILRYKLWDIGVIVRDTLSATLTLFLGVGGFSLIHLAVSRGIPAELGVARSVVTFVAGLILAGLLVPTRHSIGEALERLQYRGTYRLRRALTSFGRELLHERELGRLCSGLLDHLENALSLERVNLYLAQGDALVRVRPEPATPDRLAHDALGAELWERPFAVLSPVALPTPELSATQQLHILGYRYAFPLQVRDTRVGLVVVGYKLGATPLSSEDLDLVRGLLTQSALAIENAQLMSQLQQQLRRATELQEQNQEIIESSPAGIAVLDRDERIVSANVTFAELAGAGRETVVGRPLREVLEVQPPAPGELLEASFCDRSGTERFLQLSVAGVEGEALRILVVQDVSSRVAMENELKEKERLAALGMLAAGVAHEVNTPITGISSYAQMLLSDTRPDDPRYDLLKKVERQTFRAARIVSNLLEFARERQNPQRPLELLPVLRESLELLRERMTETRVELDFEPGGARPQVVGNDGELQQVFTNLVINALDAMAQLPPSSPRGRRLTVAVEEDAALVRVRFCDTGPGIPEELLEKVFQPFFSTKLAKGGTGLGLSISYAIARRHRGTIRVDSRPGGGCCFIVELPRLGAADDDAASPAGGPATG
jgi:PAS domain S-box-containing protein